MMQTFVDLLALVVTVAILMVATEYTVEWWTARQMRKRREADWLRMKESIDYWAQMDNEFSRAQKRLRGEK